MLSSLVSRAAAPSQDVLFAAAQADSQAGVGALCFIVWDTFIHLDDEVEFIWRGLNTWIKFMYLFIRYFPILAQITLLTITTSDTTGVHFSTRGCRDWVIYQAAVVEAVTLAVEIVLIVRVYALYNHNKPMLFTLSVLFLGEVATMIASLILTIPRMEFNAQCLITAAPDVFMAYWLSSLAFETILFALTLISLYSSVRRGLGERTILYVFVRDGTWAFALIFVIMLLNTLMYKLNNTPLAGICYFWALSVISFSGAHVLLNLRRLSASDNRVGRLSGSTSGSVFTTHVDFGFNNTQDANAAGGASAGSSGGGTHDSESTADVAGEVIALKDMDA